MGEKTAAKWIAEFGSLAELVDRVDEVKGKAGDALREHLGDVLRNRQLTELARDVPLDWRGPGDLRPQAWDREQIHQLFDTLQFRVLRDRLYTTLPNGICGSRRPSRHRGRAGRRGFDVEVSAARPGRAGRMAGRARRGGRRPAAPGSRSAAPGAAAPAP